MPNARLFAVLLAAVLAYMPALARADFEDDASNYVGYTIVAVKTIDAFKDQGKEQKDGFEGCDYDRIIVFTDGTAVTCRGYHYHYAYRPKAVILGTHVTFQGRTVTTFKMIVQGDAYDVSGR